MFQYTCLNPIANVGLDLLSDDYKKVEDLKEAIIKSKTFEPIEYQPNNQKMLKILENFIENI